jgi:phosphofructokinase-like protein
MKRIGVLNGGGDCPGLNSVLRAITKTAINRYGWEVVGFRDGYHGLVLDDALELTLAEVSGILSRGGTILGTSNRDNPFHFKVEGPDGASEFRDMSDQAIANLKKHDVECLVIVGGDGTLASALAFSDKGVKIVGVPKTIDNDLNATDMTFGFMTAVNTATDAIDKLHSTAESHHRIMILEVMGRYAGWIALYSGLAGGADIILIPEVPYDIGKVTEAINFRKNAGKVFSIVVVAEGAKSKGGDIVIRCKIDDSFDPIRLGGVGHQVGGQLEQMTGIETRVTVLGHLQRGGSPSAYDRILSSRYGVAAVELIHEEKYGLMVSLQGGHITSVPLAKAIGKMKMVPTGGEMIRVAKHIGIKFGD